MKYLILLGFCLLTACHTKTCDKEFRDYHYGDKVKVIAGFYKGQQGVILARTWIYESNDCNTPSFVIRLEETSRLLDDNEVRISQYQLEVY